jgi:hypothetical protein
VTQRREKGSNKPICPYCDKIIENAPGMSIVEDENGDVLIYHTECADPSGVYDTRHVFKEEE